MKTSKNKSEIPFIGRLVKRTFDILFAGLGLLLLFWIILAAALAAKVDTKHSGFFLQQRVGRHGRLFTVIKIRTMRPKDNVVTFVTTTSDERITNLGRFLRKYKIDELPQLINVLLGQMSFVGPRPDVPSYADKLMGEDRLMLTVRPGITGPATLKYRHEEAILATQPDPEKYNKEVIWPDKVRINCEYVKSWRFLDDVKYIWQTVAGTSDNNDERT